MFRYEEACRHNFAIHAFQNTSGHFSQLVWKATEEIGVGRAFGKKWGMNCSFIVARYRPKGNVDEKAAFKENVEKGTFDPVAYNCSAVNSGTIPRGESQVKDAGPGNQLQENGIQDKSVNNAEFSLGNRVSSRYSNMQRYRDMYFKNSRGLRGNLLGAREANAGYVRVPGYGSNPTVSRVRSQHYQANNGDNLPQFMTESMNEYETRPRSFRAKVPHRPNVMKGDNEVVWFLP